MKMEKSKQTGKLKPVPELRVGEAEARASSGGGSLNHVVR